MKFFSNMIDTWFRKSFYAKCNPNIKLTLTRIEIIKRRRKAMEKYLRNDIADLLRNGFVDDAYRRAAGLYLDQNRSLCYDFIEQYCMLILSQLTAMNDKSECPEECREAVPCLIYAAARIADLPELRELRSLFTERYGNSLESFINKEFVHLLKRDPPTHDMKIQLMQEIALEHGVEWDPDSLEPNSNKSPPSNHDRSENVYGDGDNESNKTRNESDLMIKIQEKGNQEGSNGELEKQTDQVRKRILDYWSRTTSLFSTSRETSSSSDDSSSDDSGKGRSFFGFRQKNNGNKENQEVSNNPNIQILDEDATSAPDGKNRQRRNGGPSPRVKSHSTECLPNPLVRRTRKGHVRAASDMPANPPRGHVHPKLPDYDEIKARFAALRTKS